MSDPFGAAGCWPRPVPWAFDLFATDRLDHHVGRGSKAKGGMRGYLSERGGGWTVQTPPSDRQTARACHPVS
jgi:hypothetical protein